jgi:hypothetical protein
MHFYKRDPMDGEGEDEDDDNDDGVKVENDDNYEEVAKDKALRINKILMKKKEQMQ